MSQKRIIGIIVIKNGKAVQSFCYNTYLPLGSPSCIAKNLDRWNVDEIILLDIDRSKDNYGPNLKLLEEISSLPISTPLIYGGGIKSYQDALKVISSGAERVVLDNIVFENFNEIKKIAECIGRQSIIISVPIIKVEKSFYHINYLNNNKFKVQEDYFERLLQYASEIMIIDKENEGSPGQFDLDIQGLARNHGQHFIAFGGISINQIKNFLKLKNISAVALGNILNYTEIAIPKIREIINSPYLRKTEYSTDWI